MTVEPMPPILHLTADLLRAAPPADLAPAPVPLPRLKAVALVRRLNGAEYRDYLADVRKADPADGEAVQVAHALGDPAGRRLFPDPKGVPLHLFTAAELRAVQHEFVRLNLPDPEAVRGN